VLVRYCREFIILDNQAHPERTISEFDAQICIRLRVRRLSLGLTQKELGAKVGVLQGRIQKHENGTSQVTAGRLWHLANALDVPVEYFLENFDRGEAVNMPAKAQTLALRDLVMSSEGYEFILALGSIQSSLVRDRLLKLMQAAAV